MSKKIPPNFPIGEDGGLLSGRRLLLHQATPNFFTAIVF
jgi:hypothetical protein